MTLDASILKDMTLAEKIGQLTMVTAGYATTGPIVAGDVTGALREGRIGSLFNLWGRDAIRAAQRVAVEETRLGIPLFFGLDVIHGFRTIFPTPLAQAGAFDEDLWERAAASAAAEAADAGIDLTFTPMLDVARDPRWGRSVEGPGEDPLVGARFARAQVRGLQGDDFAGEGRLAACAKHFVAYGAVTAGRDYAPVDISRRTLEEVYLPPFRAAVEAGVATLMPAFTDLDGIPFTAHRAMITGRLREEWGFDGVVISDFGAIGELIRHGVAADLAEAAALALNAGVDIDMMAGAYEKGLPEALERGLVTVATLDAAVTRVLGLKERLGLFADPYRRCRGEGTEDAEGKGGRRRLAREAGRREVFPRAEIVHAEGVPLTQDGTDGIAAAVDAARDADCVILCVGEAAEMSGEAASRTKIDLPGSQSALLDAVAATGKPLVVLLFSGRPLAVPEMFERAGAVIACGFPGSEAGHAIADVIIGREGPTGRLPTTWPRHVGQVPIFLAERSGGRPENPADKYTSKYLDMPNSPLFPFGAGLGYGEVVFADLKADVGEAIEASVTVANRGSRADEAVVFLFVRDPVASVARPVLELKDFRRVALAAGETRTIAFRLGREDLTFLDMRLEPVFEGGAFEILIGPSADRARLLSATVRFG